VSREQRLIERIEQSARRFAQAVQERHAIAEAARRETLKAKAAALHAARQGL
jgi:hypothetical protein